MKRRKLIKRLKILFFIIFFFFCSSDKAILAYKYSMQVTKVCLCVNALALSYIRRLIVYTYWNVVQKSFERMASDNGYTDSFNEHSIPIVYK